MQIMRYFALAIGVAAVAANAQTTNAISTKSLTLNDCIQLALQHNFDVRIERVNPEIARYNVSLAYAGYDPSFDLTGTHSDSTSPGGLDAQNRPFQPTSSKSDAFNVGINGQLPIDSGLTYSLAGNITQTSGDSTQFTTNGIPFLVPFQSTRGSASLGLRQPLLKNLWTDAVRLNVEVSKNQLKYSEWGLRGRIMSIVTSVETTYDDLIAARENVVVQEKALQLAEQLRAENKKKVEVGALAPLDEKQAESQVAARRADLLAAQHALDIQENLLKGLVSDEFSDWQRVTVQPAESLSAVPQILSLQASWLNGMTLRPDLEQARLDLDRQGINLKYSHNQLFPQLDLIGTFGRAGNASQYSGVFSGISEASGPFYSLGAEFRIPLGNQAARSSYKVAKALKAQLVLRLKKLEQDIMLAIDDAVKLAQTNLQRVDATKEARSYAEAALDAEQKKLENGKSTSFVVLQLQRDLTAARSAEIQALADYNKALAQLALAEGTTLERHSIHLDVK
jgi:outer membrane protein TolC